MRWLVIIHSVLQPTVFNVYVGTLEVWRDTQNTKQLC
jgi:hypothetical protein